jgi:hypothetical protein
MEKKNVTISIVFRIQNSRIAQEKNVVFINTKSKKPTVDVYASDLLFQWCCVDLTPETRKGKRRERIL